MIYDSIKNIENYVEIPNDVSEFIKNISAEIPCGKHIINDVDYANVEEYMPKDFSDCRFESHKKYIDIQMVLSGMENLDFTNVNKLVEDSVYENDVVYYTEPSFAVNRLILQEGNFVLLFPGEAHKPQIRLSNSSQMVKKVVVKILV